MILGSFLGGCKLRISISENTSPQSLNSSICQSIYGLGGWPKSYFITSPQRVKHRVMCKELCLLWGPLHQCFRNLHEYSLVPKTALKSSSDEKLLLVLQDFLHILEVKWWATGMAEVSITAGVKQMLKGWQLAPYTECGPTVRWAGASAGNHCQTDLLINDKAGNKAGDPGDLGLLTLLRLTAPHCSSRPTPHTRQSGRTRWVPKYFLSHTSRRIDLMRCWMPQYKSFLNLLVLLFFQSGSCLKRKVFVYTCWTWEYNPPDQKDLQYSSFKLFYLQ